MFLISFKNKDIAKFCQRLNIPGLDNTSEVALGEWGGVSDYESGVQTHCSNRWIDRYIKRLLSVFLCDDGITNFIVIEIALHIIYGNVPFNVTVNITYSFLITLIYLTYSLV